MNPQEYRVKIKDVCIQKSLRLIIVQAKLITA
jgi:hypothetical protein